MIFVYITNHHSLKYLHKPFNHCNLRLWVNGLNFIAPGPYHFTKLISECIRISTLLEYQYLQLSWAHGITSVTGPRRYIKNVSFTTF